MRRGWLVPLAAAVLAAAAAVSYLVLRQEPVTVETATVTEEDLSVTVIAAGSVVADERADVVPLVAGTIASVEVEPGQPVEEGDLLATVEAPGSGAEVEMTAPIDGVAVFNPVGSPSGEDEPDVAALGTPVSPQQAPFTVIDLDRLLFVAEVDESDVVRVEPGMPATVMLDAFAGEGFEGAVLRLLPTARTTGTGGIAFPLHVEIPESDRDVLVGMRGDVTIEVETEENALTIPPEALFEEGGESFVFVVKDEVLHRREVRIGALTETRIQVTQGLESGETVALVDDEELSDGMRVTAEG